MYSSAVGRTLDSRNKRLVVGRVDAKSGCWDGRGRKHMHNLFRNYTVDVVGQLLVVDGLRSAASALQYSSCVDNSFWSGLL